MEEIELLKKENEELKYKMGKYFHSPKESYELYNKETGEVLDSQDIEREIKALQSLHRTVIRKNRESTMVLNEESDIVNIKHSKHERRFLKIYYITLRNLSKDLDPLTLGMFQKFITYIRTDGTNSLSESSVKSDWYKIIDLSNKTFNKHFKILEQHNLLKYVKNKGIFINPYYARYGNEIEKTTLELFNLEFDNYHGLCYKLNVDNQ